MALLERVMRMKEYGMSESQIIDSLKQEGFSPADIKESLAQSKIKENLETENNYSDYEGNNSDDNFPMQPSIMADQNRESLRNGRIKDKNEDIKQYPKKETSDNDYPYNESENNSYQDYSYQNQSNQQQYQNDETPEQYPEYNQNYNPQQGEYSEYQPPQALDMETIGDIAEQIIEEKNEQLKKQIKSLINFKKEISVDIKRLDERMNKLEDIFTQLQISILKKVGEYGYDIKNISNEMTKTQDSFSKILNPLTDNIRELKRLAGENEKVPQNDMMKEKEIQSNKISNIQQNNINARKRTTNSLNKNPSFDDYLR